MSVPILTYHQINKVSANQDPYGLVSTPEQFAEQMAYLHDTGWRCVRLIEVVRAYKNRSALPANSFAITFDDGYRDNYETALPIMQRYSFTATIFLVADRIGQMTDWDGQTGERAFPLMSWDEIHAMQKSGIDFGSHTSTHPRLNKIPPEQAKRELCESKQKLSQGLGAPVELIAYPYEVSDPAVQKLAAECGYLGAFGISSYPQNVYNLWREELGAADTLDSLRYKISPLSYPMMEIKRRLRPIKKLLKGG
ncbi:MAG: polysaccharide deacetylase family protein [Chloroflexi bacterium]|nr:polysaccharide deacetylase family protein [Chloroflexota bacterium]